MLLEWSECVLCGENECGLCEESECVLSEEVERVLCGEVSSPEHFCLPMVQQCLVELAHKNGV